MGRVDVGDRASARRAAVAIGVVVVLTACSGACSNEAPSSPSTIRSGGGSTTTSTVTAEDLLFCVQETNRTRALVGAGVVAQSPAIEAYAAQAARADGMSNTAHGYTSGANRPGGAFAENEVLRWSLSRYGSIRALLTAAIAAFWAEGPGGPHYENMRGPWLSLGCGVYVDGDQVTAVQHFR